MFDFALLPADFFGQLFFSVYSIIMENKVIMSFFFIPVITVCVLIVLDFIFDIRDRFTDFNHFQDYNLNSKYKLRYAKYRRQSKLDMDEVYKRSKENADYKHNLKMEEMKYFRQNENLRHTHKVEENNLYERHSIPKHKDNKKENLDIENDED